MNKRPVLIKKYKYQATSIENLLDSIGLLPLDISSRRLTRNVSLFKNPLISLTILLLLLLFFGFILWFHYCSLFILFFKRCILAKILTCTMEKVRVTYGKAGHLHGFILNSPGFWPK